MQTWLLSAVMMGPQKHNSFSMKVIPLNARKKEGNKVLGDAVKPLDQTNPDTFWTSSYVSQWIFRA